MARGVSRAVSRFVSCTSETDINDLCNTSTRKLFSIFGFRLAHKHNDAIVQHFGYSTTLANTERVQMAKSGIEKKVEQLFSVIYVLDGDDTAHEAYTRPLAIPTALHREREK